jgi:RND family efflux transporter MFP subunit
VKKVAPIPLAMGLGAAGLILVGLILFWHAHARVNHVALAQSAKGVTVVEARASTFRASRRYVGTLEPWVEAKVGPQFVSAYVDTVLVRPGAAVKRGDVLATLDCRNASATSKAVSMQAHALQTMQEAIRDESLRIAQLQDGGFVSPNEVEQKRADSASKQAQVLAMEAQMLGSELQVQDCVSRAPFAGDVAERMADPGVFVKPGVSIVSLVDRSTLRLSADVPEDDFDAVAPGRPAKIRMLSTGDHAVRPISRRSPAASASTRTVHIEIDIPDPEKGIPVYTTAEIFVDVGQPIPSTELPLTAASIRGEKASLFIVRDGRAHALTVLVHGESGGSVFLDPSLPSGSLVVLEGRTLLNDGDAVSFRMEPEPRADVAAQGTTDAGETGDSR